MQVAQWQMAKWRRKRVEISKPNNNEKDGAAVVIVIAEETNKQMRVMNVLGRHIC